MRSVVLTKGLKCIMYIVKSSQSFLSLPVILQANEVFLLSFKLTESYVCS